MNKKYNIKVLSKADSELRSKEHEVIDHRVGDNYLRMMVTDVDMMELCIPHHSIVSFEVRPGDGSEIIE